MAGLYAQSGGVNRRPKQWYVSSGGVNRKLKEIWARDSSGVNRKIFTLNPATWTYTKDYGKGIESVTVSQTETICVYYKGGYSATECNASVVFAFENFTLKSGSTITYEVTGTSNINYCLIGMAINGTYKFSNLRTTATPYVTTITEDTVINTIKVDLNYGSIVNVGWCSILFTIHPIDSDSFPLNSAGSVN